MKEKVLPRVVVTGGRAYLDDSHVNSVLSLLLKKLGPFVLVHGAASGADLLAKRWARSHVVDAVSYPALWNVHGNNAGPIRNGQMLWTEKPKLVVAFPGNSGTTDMVRQARQKGVLVWDERKKRK